MKYLNNKNILVVGNGRITAGIVTNLLQSEVDIIYFGSDDIAQSKQHIYHNIADCKEYENSNIDIGRLKFVHTVSEAADIHLAICQLDEDLLQKQQAVQQLEDQLSNKAIIAVNTGSFLLSDISSLAKHPERIIGLNWCDPAHTTSFLEIIADKTTAALLVKSVEDCARAYWHKDPVTVYCGYSVNKWLMSALVREAFSLVENGYASIEDIDRACRNDAGYYLPFAGNCRYMDLMGTYAYGLVMKDLNKELSKADTPPVFFSELVSEGKTGMDAMSGFYTYDKDGVEQWENKFRKFSFEIKDIIERYPFDYKKEESKMINSKITLNE
ncbi:MAG: 3-hydroxyacyl-CoA dehydrogenase NAD-binding domain-containing protein [Agriterribacter sp.]